MPLSILAIPMLVAGAARADDTNLLDDLVATFNRGDQQAYEAFARERFAPSALKETPPDEQAAALARIFSETQGLDVERVTGATAEWIQADVRDRVGAVRYCATITRANDGAKSFALKGLYPAGPSLTDPAPRELARTLDSIATRYAARGDFSGVMLIAKDDRVVLHKAYGYASLAFERPMTIDTRLSIASIGKSLTGVVIAQLVEQGRLAYDDTVGKYLPEYPNTGVRERATIRALLAHTSGLGPDDYYNRKDWAAARATVRSVADYLKLVGDTGLDAKPGEYLYSNSGYVILGAIVERVTGKSYYDVVRERVFEPAGMKRSFFHEADAEDAGVATSLTNLFPKGDGYLYKLGRPRNAVYEHAARGGPQGGATVTAADLFAFVRALRGGKLISKESYERMTTAQGGAGAGAPGLAGEVHEGLGIEVIAQNGHKVFGHTGGDLGIASLVYWFPDTGYTTILLSNRDPRAARVLLNVSRTMITRRTIGGATPPAQACVPPP